MMDLSGEQLLEIANAYMNDLMQASTAIEYDKHCQNFSHRLRSLLDRERFEQICHQYQREKGYFAQREYVAKFRRPSSFAVIWRQTFSLAEGDYVAEMVLIEENGVIVIDHVMVF